jgi:hypothetical protein
MFVDIFVIVVLVVFPDPHSPVVIFYLHKLASISAE